MIYQWNDDVSGISEERADWEIEILSLQEFQAAYPAYYRRIFLANELSYLKFCKAERLKEAVLGTYAMPAYLEKAEGSSTLATANYRTKLFLSTTMMRSKK